MIKPIWTVVSVEKKNKQDKHLYSKPRFGQSQESTNHIRKQAGNFIIFDDKLHIVLVFGENGSALGGSHNTTIETRGKISK